MTTATTEAVARSPLVEEPKPRRFTREEYHRAAETGLFGPEERLELINGEVFCKVSPQGARHITAILLLEDALRFCLQSTGSEAGYHIRTQMPVVVSGISEPEPDIAIVRGRITRQSGPASPRDLALVCEVSDSSLEFDRTTKAALYASAGITEYWILNLRDNRIEILRDPGQLGEVAEYRSQQVAGAGAVISPAENLEWTIRVEDVLPVVA